MAHIQFFEARAHGGRMYKAVLELSLAHAELWVLVKRLGPELQTNPEP